MASDIYTRLREAEERAREAERILADVTTTTWPEKREELRLDIAAWREHRRKYAPELVAIAEAAKAHRTRRSFLSQAESWQQRVVARDNLTEAEAALDLALSALEAKGASDGK